MSDYILKEPSYSNPIRLVFAFRRALQGIKALLQRVFKKAPYLTTVAFISGDGDKIEVWRRSVAWAGARAPPRIPSFVLGPALSSRLGCAGADQLVRCAMPTTATRLHRRIFGGFRNPGHPFWWVVGRKPKGSFIFFKLGGSVSLGFVSGEANRTTTIVGGPNETT